MRWKADEVDSWCGEWARTRRLIHGIVVTNVLLPHKHETVSHLTPAERLGKLACTLGRIEEEREGAATAGVVNQNFPEVYAGMGLLMHRGWHSMPVRSWRLVMDAHYVWKEIPVRLKAPQIPVSTRDYWVQLDILKAYLNGYVNQNRDAEEVGYRVPHTTYCRVNP